MSKVEIGLGCGIAAAFVAASGGRAGRCALNIVNVTKRRTSICGFDPLVQTPGDTYKASGDIVIPDVTGKAVLQKRAPSERRGPCGAGARPDRLWNIRVDLTQASTIGRGCRMRDRQ
jgi:hypothetical protein